MQMEIPLLAAAYALSWGAFPGLGRGTVGGGFFLASVCALGVRADASEIQVGHSWGMRRSGFVWRLESSFLSAFSSRDTQGSHQRGHKMEWRGVIFLPGPLPAPSPTGDPQDSGGAVS